MILGTRPRAGGSVPPNKNGSRGAPTAGPLQPAIDQAAVRGTFLERGARLGAPASLAIDSRRSMISISITAEAFAAIRATLPHSDEPPSMGPDGLIRIWLDRAVVDRLTALRGPGESYSDVIIRLAEEGNGSEE